MNQVSIETSTLLEQFSGRGLTDVAPSSGQWLRSSNINQSAGAVNEFKLDAGRCYPILTCVSRLRISVIQPTGYRLDLVTVGHPPLFPI